MWLLKGIAQHPSYHGPMTAKEAERKLRRQRTNCYLTRLTTKRRKYVLSVLRWVGDAVPIVRNFNVNVTHENDTTLYEIEGTENKVKDIFQLLEFYRDQPMSHEIDGIGNCLRAEAKAMVGFDEADFTVTTDANDQNWFSDAELTMRRQEKSLLSRQKSSDDVSYRTFF